MNDTPTLSGHCALRLGRHSEPGRVYLVTTTAVGRHPWFTEPDAAFACARASVSSEVWQDARLLCWVLMPDHWHGIIELGSDNTLDRVMNRFKSVTANAVNRALGRSGEVWARAFHDHALRVEEDLLATARYVVLNPVRAGLVTRVWDYSFWDAVWLESKDRALKRAPTNPDERFG